MILELKYKKMKIILVVNKETKIYFNLIEYLIDKYQKN